MCGIAGVFDTRGQSEVPSSLIERMNAVQFHRGPDDGGVHIEPGLGLGHRRLSIIDLSPAGHQPFFDDTGNVGVVYNGEIYNFRELRSELEDLGFRFRSNCDTEVIVHGWSAWGEACVDRFRGMFAFALWDRTRQSLFLGRDRVGIKPLYYAELPDGQFVFASELKALAEHPGLPREIDPCAVEEYFTFGYIPDPRTIFRHACKLPPGHRMTVRRGEAVDEPVSYWDIPFGTDPVVADHAGIDDELMDRLREAVEIRRVADVPLGAFLSGGVDSSAVVAMMAEGGGEPVMTSSIGFGNPEFDESEYARRVAERYGTDHQVRQVEADDFDLMERLVGLYDEPYADSSAIPTYRVCELARSRVTVALSGDGGDETFAGYRRYRWYGQEERVRGLLPDAIRGPLFGALGHMYPKLNRAPKYLRAKSTLLALSLDSIHGYLDAVSVVKGPFRQQIFSDRLRSDLQGHSASEVFRGHMDRAPDHPVQRAQYLDFKTYLPGDILTKVDRASMAHSLEVRVPILDHQLLEWAARFDPALNIHGREGKRLFKRALQSRLPHELLYRRKMGFAVPVSDWFRGPLRQTVRDRLLGPELLDSGLFDPDGVRSIIDHHQSGHWDHSAPIWAMLMFAGFHRRFLGSGS